MIDSSKRQAPVQIGQRRPSVRFSQGLASQIGRGAELGKYLSADGTFVLARCYHPDPRIGIIKGLAPLGPSLSPLSPRQRTRRISVIVGILFHSLTNQ